MSDGFQYKNHNIYIENPYVSKDKKHYQAFGASIDENGIEWEFKLLWKIKEEFIGNEDITCESDICNWDEFEVIELGQKL